MKFCSVCDREYFFKLCANGDSGLNTPIRNFPQSPEKTLVTINGDPGVSILNKYLGRLGPPLVEILGIL